MSKNRMKALNEQVIVLTGASNGIGLATARMAAERGAKVIISSQNEEELRTVSEEIRQKNGECLFVVADCTRYEELLRLKDTAIKNFGRIDTWINTAGDSFFGYLMDTPFEIERKLFETNFWGTRMGCQVAVDGMKEGGGTIINMGSEVSVAAQPLLGIYTATKNAVKAMTDALRSELRDRNIPIEVTLMCPTAMGVSPDECAEAILKNAENPQRDVYVGGPAKLSAIIDTFFPQVKDMVAETKLKELQQGTPDYTDLTTMSFIKSITQSARKSLENFRRAG
ncbi:MAG: SDR family NAD(P)-dependent oxidoreductase [Bdellovibrionota bacterium]